MQSLLSADIGWPSVQKWRRPIWSRKEQLEPAGARQPVTIVVVERDDDAVADETLTACDDRALVTVVEDPSQIRDDLFAAVLRGYGLLPADTPVHVQRCDLLQVLRTFAKSLAALNATATTIIKRADMLTKEDLLDLLQLAESAHPFRIVLVGTSNFAAAYMDVARDSIPARVIGVTPPPRAACTLWSTRSAIALGCASLAILFVVLRANRLDPAVSPIQSMPTELTRQVHPEAPVKSSGVRAADTKPTDAAGPADAHGELLGHARELRNHHDVKGLLQLRESLLVKGASSGGHEIAIIDGYLVDARRRQLQADREAIANQHASPDR
jgi:hypothetical protein